MALLEICNVVKTFEGYEALKGISFSVEAGEFFTLLGPSGCGKTTLLRLIAGFDVPDTGLIRIGGLDMSDTQPEARPVHTVFQNYALFPHLTVAQNIAFPLRLAGMKKSEVGLRVEEALENVALPRFGDRYPAQISAGQRQRVALARALVHRPRILLLDEPLSALDAQLREQMQRELIALQKEVGIAFVYVTHDQGEALALSHRIALMRAGHLEQIDTPETIYSLPQNAFVADFIGQCNLLPARVLAVLDGRMQIEIAGLGLSEVQRVSGVAPGCMGMLALRPEKIRLSSLLKSLSSEETCFRGNIESSLYLGDVTIYTVELEDGLRIEAMLPNSSPGRAHFYEDGDSVEVSWRFDAGHFLPGAS